jgi:LacI family transcriptional regulator
MLTQRDIARELGVSVSSVSLVLSGRADGRVRPAMAERIAQLATELGYVPNQLAQSLKRGQTHTIGLLSDEVATVPFSGHLLAGAQREAWKAQYLLLLIDMAGQPEMRDQAVRSLLQRNIEALIIATAYHRSVEVPVAPSSLPIVVLDGIPADPDAAVDSVVPDERSGAAAAVAHLVSHGHTRIGFINVPDAYPLAAGLRLRGYLDALEAAGITPDAGLIVDAADASTADAWAPAHALLSRPDRPTAVFCFGDQIAMGVYQVAQSLGLSVPGDLSVAGFDNQQFVADSLTPGLSTVQLPHNEMGEWATRRALARIAGSVTPGERHVMPCPFVVRESVAAPPF